MHRPYLKPNAAKKSQRRRRSLASRQSSNFLSANPQRPKSAIGKDGKRSPSSIPHLCLAISSLSPSPFPSLLPTPFTWSSMASTRALSRLPALAASARRPAQLGLARTRPGLLKTNGNGLLVQQAFRRGYADEKVAGVPLQGVAQTMEPPTKKKSGFRYFRWAWRATYLSLIGSVVYMGYDVYMLRNPQDQIEPLPGKKTLVVLGECSCCCPGRGHWRLALGLSVDSSS